MTDGGAVGLVARSHHGATLHCGSVGKVASAERAGWQCGGVGTVSTVGLVARSHQGATLHFGLGGDKKRAGQLAVVRLLGGSDLLSHFRSTIGAVRFNFSVRNGKRWNPHAITTLVSFSPLCVRCVKVRSFLEVQNAVSRAVVPLEASSVSFYSRPRLRSAFSCVKAWLRGFVPADAVLPRCLGATRSLGGVAFARKAVGILVLFGWDIAALTPATYLRRSLQRPSGRSYLGEGFVLRCFQHLSFPDADTRQCPGRDNR